MDKYYTGHYSEQFDGEASYGTDFYNAQPTDYEMYKANFMLLAKMYGDKAKIKEYVECGYKSISIEVQVSNIAFRRSYSLKTYNGC